MFVMTLRAEQIEVLLKSGACHIGIYKGAGVFGLRSSLTRRSIHVGTKPPPPHSTGICRVVTQVVLIPTWGTHDRDQS